jgi:hypothetical protein
MKSYLIIPLIFTLLISCDSQKGNTINLNSIDIDRLDKESIDSTLIDTSSEYVISNVNIGAGNAFSFKFNTDSVSNYLRSIDVFLGQSVLQNISVEQESYRSYNLTDWNFDGYKDISVCQGCGSGGCTYLIWSYLPSQNRFNFNEILSGIFGLERDSINEQIIVHRRGGFSFETWKCFDYPDGEILIFSKGREAKRSFDSLGELWEKNTITELINNKLVSKIDSFIIDK